MEAESDPRAQVTAARSLVRQQAAVRRRARDAADAEMAALVAALRARASRELELERGLDAARAEQALLQDLAEEQARRCAAAQRAERAARGEAAAFAETAAHAVEKAKAARAEARELRAKEAEAVAEINRRAVQQAQLRETIQHLQAQAAQHRITSAEALALQDKLETTRKTLAEALRERDEDRTDQEHETAQLRAALARAQKAAQEAEAKVYELEAAPAPNVSRAVHASSVDSREVSDMLQQKVEEQMLEIIRLQTEVTLREKRILEVKQEAQEDIARAQLSSRTPSPRPRTPRSDAATTATSGDEATDAGNDGPDDTKSSKDRDATEVGEQERIIADLAQKVETLEGDLQRARAEASKLRSDLASRGEHELQSQKEIVALNERLLHRERELQDAMREREALDARELQDAREQANELQADMDTRLLEVARLQSALSKAQNDELQARKAAQEAERKYADLAAASSQQQQQQQLSTSARSMPARQLSARSNASFGGASASEDTVPSAVMEEMRMLAKLCQSLSAEASSLRARFQSSGEELAQECRELRDQSTAQASEAKRLREQLETFRELYAATRRENAALEADLRNEALQIHQEAARISGATRQVLHKTADLKRKYFAGAANAGPTDIRESAIPLSARRRKAPNGRAQPQQVDGLDWDEGDRKADDLDNNFDDFGGSDDDDDAAAATINEAAPEYRSRRGSAADRLSEIEAENAREAELPTPKSPLEEDDEAENERWLDGEDFDEDDDGDGEEGENGVGRSASANEEDAQSAFGAKRNKRAPKTRVLLNGYLQKSPRSVANKPYWARWARRWFVLTSSTLLYFRTASSKAPRAVLDLRYIQVYGPKNELDERGCKFYLRTPDRVYQLCAENTPVLRTWLDALEDAIAELPAKARERTISQVSALDRPAALYKVLGVSKRASLEDIAAAYEAKAAKFHPDVNPNPDMEAFNLLEKAFSVLGTPSLRADYNVSLDIRRLFEGGFVAMLHPESAGPRQGGSFRARKAVYRRFLSDLGFQSIMWGPPAGNFDMEDAGCGAIPLVEIDSVRNGEDAVEGAMLRLPAARSTQCFSLVSGASRRSGEPPLVVNIEVDSPTERDKIVHGLRILVQEARDSNGETFADSPSP